MQITSSLHNPYKQSSRGISENPKTEYRNQIPKRVAISVGIFASLNVVEQLLVKNSKKIQSWVSESLVDEISQKGFSRSHLGKDIAIGALLGIILGYFENKENKKQILKA